jgi:hypothetical protein
MRRILASLSGLVLAACGSAAPDREAEAGPAWTDYVAAVGYAARAELSRPSNECRRDQRDPEWIEAAERMGERDQLARSGDVSDQRWRELDAENEAELAALLEEKGWPEPCRLTRAAARGLFFVVQHHGDAALRREALPHLEAMALAGQLTRSDFALLVDRVLTHQDLPQRYGTQYVCRDGAYQRVETEDPDHLDQRRREMNLMPADMEQRLINRDRPLNRCMVR